MRTALIIPLLIAFGGLCPGPLRTQAEYVPNDFGQQVNGFQDDFNTPRRDPNWVAAPRDRDLYEQKNGLLKVTVRDGDPNHLLYQVPGYNPAAQEVLARIRVRAFGGGEQTRAGIAVGVDGGSQGLNLVFCDLGEAGGGRQFKLLDDYRAWGPKALNLKWKNDSWYWLRLRQTTRKGSEGRDIHGKVWLADGTVPEPEEWSLNWRQGGRNGFAGIQGSAGGLAEFEVDYILIKAEGLSLITVGRQVSDTDWLRIVQPPLDVTLGAGETAAVSVGVEASTPPTFQWQMARAGSTNFTDIAGATGPKYSTAAATEADHGTRYRCLIAIPAMNMISRAAMIRVDTAPPALVAAHTFGRSDQVTVVFSEAISAPISGNNFAIDNDIGISGAVQRAKAHRVELTTTPMASGKTYTLTVTEVKDQFGNEIRPNSTISIDPSPKDTFWLVPHTHWEGAVFATRESYLEMGLPNILTALKLLKEYPDYCFTLDQVCYVKPFLERYPEEARAFRRFVAEGRLQIVGGTDTMHDSNVPSGESLVRQFLYGKGYYREKLGVEVTVGWELDTFGHNAQAPQLLKLAGYKSLWFARGVPDSNVPSEFLWQGIDGTPISAFWLPNSYALLSGAPNNVDAFTGFCKARFDSLNHYARGPDRVGLAGPDVAEPEVHVPGIVQEFNQQSEAPFTLRFGVPTDFEAAVARRMDRPVIQGELNPIFQGGYSSRIELKQRLRNVERLLTAAEKLGALGHWLGQAAGQEDVWRAWEPSLFNQAHDLMSGVMTDHVYEDTLRGYDFSQRLGKELVETRLDSLVSQVDTRGEGMCLVVFNPLGWTRTDSVETEVGFAQRGVLDIQAIGPADQAIPVEISEADRYADGGLKRAKIIFLAREVPALGYAVYRVVPLTAASPLNASEGPAGETLENEHYRATIDRLSGAMTSLVVKPGQWEALSGPANVVAREHDGGDLWELYQNLNAGMSIGSKRQQPVPKAGKAQFSKDYVGASGTVRRGPVYSEYKVAHAFGTNGAFATRVRLYSGIRRIDIRTRIVNNEKYVRYQVLFPTTIENGRNVNEIPFGAIERPLGIEYPAQNWADYGDGEKGLALLNRGLPGNLVSEGTLLLSLMRSARIAAYGYGGGYEPGMTSDTGLEIGKDLTFHYALVPHAGDWRQARVYQAGLEFNHPFICRKAEPHVGKLPKRWGLLDVSHPNVVITALKPGREGATVFRLYEASGQATAGVTIRCQARIVGAHEANLMEDTGRELKVDQDTLRFDLRPFEIKTFKLRLQALTDK